jgi:pyruvate dehydrogenase E1 component alpha subunit
MWAREEFGDEIANHLMMNSTEADFEAIDARVKALVQECVEFGEQSPFPEAHELWQDIYVQENYPFIKE